MRRILMPALLALAACGVQTASAGWVEVLKVDILDDTHTDSQYIEDGFVGWAPKVTEDADPPPVSTTINGITISFDVGAYQQDRYRSKSALNGVPYEALYRDSFWGRAADLNDKGLDITLSGLEPDETYLVALYCFDYADFNGTQSCDWSANGEFAFNASWYADSPIDKPTAWDSFRHTVVVNADANGEILMTSSPGDGTPSTTYWANCSALEIYAVPEPSVAISALTLLAAAFGFRRQTR